MADTTETTIAPTKTEERKAAIAEAIKAADVTPPAEDTKVEDTQAVKEEKVEKAESAPVELTEADKLLQQQGLQLIQALRDPTQAPIVIKFLAEQGGYVKAGESVTKAESQEAADDLLAALDESLGPEFKYLTEKLAPAIRKGVSKIVEQNNEDIRQEFQRQEEEKLTLQSKTALDSLAEDFFGKGEALPAKVEQEMSKLMDKYQPAEDMSVKEYISDIFKLATSNLNMSKNDKAKQERTNKNRNDAPSRLASERSPAEENIQVDTTKLSRRDAIKLAVEAANRG